MGHLPDKRLSLEGCNITSIFMRAPSLGDCQLKLWSVSPAHYYCALYQVIDLRQSKCCRMCVAPSRADFWSVVMLGIMPIFLRCFFSKCGIDLNTPITTGIPFVFLFHTLALSTMKSRYLSVVSKIIF